ncbi:hypothetical protein [Mucilaginibacter rubeus]|jgi:hypothetical protein
MRKDKGGKNVKKEPATGSKKTLSDYQAGKKLTSNSNLINNKKAQ